MPSGMSNWFDDRDQNVAPIERRNRYQLAAGIAEGKRVFSLPENPPANVVLRLFHPGSGVVAVPAAKGRKVGVVGEACCRTAQIQSSTILRVAAATT